jgi:hypothetical protein
MLSVCTVERGGGEGQVVGKGEGEKDDEMVEGEEG